MTNPLSLQSRQLPLCEMLRIPNKGSQGGAGNKGSQGVRETKGAKELELGLREPRGWGCENQACCGSKGSGMLHIISIPEGCLSGIDSFFVY